MSDAYEKQLHKALKKGAGYHTHGNRTLEILGDSRLHQTHYGVLAQLFGSLTAQLYNTRILGVDFINKRLTCFQIEAHHYGRSPTTQQNIRGWESAIRTAFKAWLPAWWYQYRYWTKPAPAGSAYALYRSRMPWFYSDRGVIWFQWEKYDAKLHAVYGQSLDFLRKDRNNLYFEYYWNEQGTWTHRFKDADATRRWKQREKKRKKARRELSQELPGAP